MENLKCRSLESGSGVVFCLDGYHAKPTGMDPNFLDLHGPCETPAPCTCHGVLLTPCEPICFSMNPYQPWTCSEPSMEPRTSCPGIHQPSAPRPTLWPATMDLFSFDPLWRLMERHGPRGLGAYSTCRRTLSEMPTCINAALKFAQAALPYMWISTRPSRPTPGPLPSSFQPKWRFSSWSSRSPPKASARAAVASRPRHRNGGKFQGVGSKAPT